MLYLVLKKDHVLPCMSASQPKHVEERAQNRRRFMIDSRNSKQYYMKVLYRMVSCDVKYTLWRGVLHGNAR